MAKWLIILFSFQSVFVFSQNVSDIEIINKFLVDFNASDSIVYTDKISEDVINYLLNFYLSKEVIGKDKDTIKLTRKELVDLVSELKVRETQVWNDSLLIKSKRVPVSSLDTISAAYKTSKLYFIYSFMKPIYIRRNNVCLFYISKHCGTECFAEEMVFLEFVNEKWKRKAIVFKYSTLK